MSFRAIRPAFRASTNLVARRLVASPAIALRPAFRAISSTPRRLGSGETDANLTSALSAEHKFELENASSTPEVPSFVEQFKTQGIWEIEDIPGVDDVVITRKFGNETIKLSFQVSDLDDPAFPTPELASEGESADPEATVVDRQEPISLSCSLLITKHAQPNALLVDLETSDQGFEITNVASYEKALAEQDGSEGDWQRRSKYMGPHFEHLDPTVQEAFGAYLAERGVDEALADFILSYAEQKEQKEYVSWLEQIKGFVEK